MRWAVWLACLVMALASLPASADELRPGYLEFTQKSPTAWTLVWKAPMRSGVTPATLPILPEGCAKQGNPQRRMVPPSFITTYDVTCTGDVAGRSLGISHFTTAQTDILVRVAPLGRAVQALRLTPSEPVVTIAAQADRWQVARTYAIIGVEHILMGYDHLLFVVALVLLLRGFRTIALAVTAFTVAHSLTLIGTTLGFLGLPQRPVEAVIAQMCARLA
jgi:hypothetical protein